MPTPEGNKASSFLDEVASLRVGRHQPAWERIISTLSPEDLEGFRQAIHDSALPIPAVATVLKNRGAQVGTSTLSRWRLEGLPDE